MVTRLISFKRDLYAKLIFMDRLRERKRININNIRRLQAFLF
jgi:hypothetical protein